MRYPDLLVPIASLVEWAVTNLQTTVDNLEVFTFASGVDVFVGRRLPTDRDPNVAILPQSDDEWTQLKQLTTIQDSIAPGLQWYTLSVDEPTLVRSHGQLWSGHMLLIPSNLGATRRLRAYYDRRSDRYMLINRIEVLFNIKHREAGKLFATIRSKNHAIEIVTHVLNLIQEHGSAGTALAYIMQPGHTAPQVKDVSPDQVHSDIVQCLRTIVYRPHRTR